MHPRLLAAVALGAAWLWIGPVAEASEPPVASVAATPLARPGREWNLRQTPVVDVVRRVRAAVVNIHSERTVRGPDAEELFSLAPSQNRVNGMGTGIVIDPRGFVITNQHVVEDVNVIRVRLSDGTSASARVLARDHEADLALLKIDVNRPLPTVPLGTAADLMVGETVIAIGNAYGYEHTVTVGVVSAIKRDVTLNKDVSYKQLIQTDASINPGNSGGPLLNVYGELVGVNVAIRAGAQGIGFAIPVDTMVRVGADLLKKRGGPSHGLAVRDEVNALREEDRPLRQAVVERIEANGPGARAGVQRGDVLVSVSGQPVASSLDLERAILDRAIGDKMIVVVRRNGAEQKLEMALEAGKAAAPVQTDLVWRKLGVRLQAASAELVSRTNQQLHGGLVVAELRPDSPAAKAGIQRGDVLVGLHQWETVTPENVQYVLTHPDLASFSPLRFYVIRSGQVHRGWLPNLD
jgi:serine protease Do